MRYASAYPVNSAVYATDNGASVIQSALGTGYEGKIKVVDRSNKKWFLVMVED